MARKRIASLTLGALLGVSTFATVATQAEANTQTGIASWYQMGHTTANGEAYNPDGMTAAHRTLPFGTIVQVHNLSNGKSVRLRINDRGPFIGGRIIDVSRGGARKLGLIASGTAKVKVTTLLSGTGARAVATSSGDAKWRCRAFASCS